MYGRNNKVPVHLYRIPGASETNMVVLQKVLQDYRGNANIKGEFGNILSDSFVIVTQHATVHTPCETGELFQKYSTLNQHPKELTLLRINF